MTVETRPKVSCYTYVCPHSLKAIFKAWGVDMQDPGKKNKKKKKEKNKTKI